MAQRLALFGNLIFRKPEIQAIEKPDDPRQKESLAKEQCIARPHPTGERTPFSLQQLHEIESILNRDSRTSSFPPQPVARFSALLLEVVLMVLLSCIEGRGRDDLCCGRIYIDPRAVEVLF